MMLPLTEVELRDLEAKRRWVREHLDESSRDQYETLEGKLRLLDTIIRNDWIDPRETLKWQCLGVTFGDALAQAMNLAWVAVEDEHGRDPALAVAGTSIRLFPLTSISRRVEQGERVVLADLFENACSTVRRLRQEAD